MSQLDRPIAVRVAAVCGALGFSPRTAEAYGQRLVAFEDWIGLAATEASQPQAAAWLMASGGGRSTRHTVFHNRCALVFLFRHLRGEELEERIVPRTRLPPPRLRRVADPREIALVLAALANPQHRWFCQFIYGTGVRIGEALATTIGDIEASDFSLLVRRGKGGRQRRTIMPQSLLDLVAATCRGWPASSLIFTRDGRPGSAGLCEDRVRESLHAARRRAGLGAHVTIHQLRHSFATHLHERGVGLVELQRLLGHSSVHTTVHYIGLREERRADIARVGDLNAALPSPVAVQQRIPFQVVEGPAGAGRAPAPLALASAADLQTFPTRQAPII